MIIDLVPIWAFLIGLAVFLYVLLDGFDLGVGILYGFAPDALSRTIMMNSIAPIWDGNETWLVFGGLSLLAAFPLAFAIIIPAVYLPILIMLLALIFRGVAFEFRFRDVSHVTFWDRAFSVGSFIATFAQGIILGTLIQGVSVKDYHFVGNSFDCFTFFSFFTGFALTLGYGLLGAGWLILKTESKLQIRARHQGRWCFLGVLVAIVVVSIWTPLMDETVAKRWFSWPNIIYLSPVPLLTGLIALWTWRSLNNDSESIPFIGAISLFALSYFGIAISFYPMIIPHYLSLWDVAASSDTQLFLLLGTLFLLPIILMYTAWTYWVFRGKVNVEHGYH